MCLIDHGHWHLWYDILENKKFDLKNLPKISEAFTIAINLTPSSAWFKGVSLRETADIDGVTFSLTIKS